MFAALQKKTADERRFIVPGLYRRGAGLLPAGLRQWRRAEGRGLGIGERGAQDFSMSTSAKNAKEAKINEFVL